MLALEVSVNGQRRYIAGHAESEMLNVIVYGNRKFLVANLSSFVAVPDTSGLGLATLNYEDTRLAIGDEVVIRVVDVETVDRPARRNTAEGSLEIVASADSLPGRGLEE